MSDWRDAFYDAVKEYLEVQHSYLRLKIKKVTGLEQNDPSPYYCETCGPDPIQVAISYIDNNDRYQTAFVYTTISDIMEHV